MLAGLHDASDAEQAQIAVDVGDAPANDPLDTGNGAVQSGGKVLDRHIDVDVLAEPLKWDSHRS